MPLTIIVGGQFGGEGKGLVTAHLVKNDTADLLVKIGGPNSSHTFSFSGRSFRVRMVPSGANLGARSIVYPAGCLINVPCLFEELKALDFGGSIYVDPNAGIVDSGTVSEQQSDPFYGTVGSTLTGTGHASSKRALRRLTLARDAPELSPYLIDTTMLLRDALDGGRYVLAEGAQAFGLSNYHGEYPFVSSRDTTVGSALGQLGLGPSYLTSAVLVLKCFPTRNKGGQGQLAYELGPELLNKYPSVFDEVGGGSYGPDPGFTRRVGLFDFGIVDRAVVANTPQWIALTGADRLQSLWQERAIADHYGTVEQFIKRLETRYGIPVGLVASGPAIENVLDRRYAIPEPNP